MIEPHQAAEVAHAEASTAIEPTNVVSLSSRRQEPAQIPALPETIVSPSEKALDFVSQGLIQHHGPYGAYAKLIEAAGRIFPHGSTTRRDR